MFCRGSSGSSKGKLVVVGKIIKGIAGEYFVHVENEGIFTCKAKGVFRHKNLKPLGDYYTFIYYFSNLQSKANLKSLI